MIVLDTGVIFGAADVDDPRHEDCADLFDSLASMALGVTVPVIVESSWLIESRLGPTAEATFFQSLARGEIERLDLTDADWSRVGQLVENYTDLGLGVVDASVVAGLAGDRLITVAGVTERRERRRALDARDARPITALS